MKTEPGVEPLTLKEIASMMNPRQYRFCLEYLVCHNARVAYSRVYGVSSDPNRQAYKVRHSVLVEQFLAAVQQIEWENRLADETRKARERCNFNFFAMFPRQLNRAPRGR
ncbi:MAG: hypothetical protein V4662_18960 [Verrucomicrobiota bacterium]